MATAALDASTRFAQTITSFAPMLVDPATAADTLLGLVRDLGRGGDSQIVEGMKSC